MTDKRKKIEEMIDKTLMLMDPTGINAKKYRNMFQTMNDAKFSQWMDAFLSNEKECDFHFMRMDNDGTWSEKDGYKGEIRKVVKASGEPALPDEINYENWTFQGYYWIL